MPTFWDLPRDVRDKIYRFSLVQEAPVDLDGFKLACGLEDVIHSSYQSTKRGKPYLFHFGTRTEREAAGIFFGENTFFLASPHQINLLKSITWPRHFKLIRKVSVSGWNMPFFYGQGYNESFRVLGTLKSLSSLTLRIDEQASLERLLKRHGSIKWHKSLGLSPQLHLQVLNLSGIHGLLSLRNVHQIDFPPTTPSASVSATEINHPNDQGEIVGGFLDTTLRYTIARPVNRPTYKRKGLFRFLELPPEIRNVVYGLLLSFPGVAYPTAEKPTSVAYKFPYLRGVDKNDIPVPDSALAILAANHQIHNEAAKIFYQNDLVFSYPSHLQAFALNLETDRLRAIRSLTLFYKDHNEGGVHTMGVTLKLLRRMSGLKKFHLLVENHLVKLTTYSFTTLAMTTPSEIHGVAVLFSLRGIPDIQLRDLGLEDCYAGFAVPKTHGPSKYDVEKKVQMLKHFNRGLALAQQGVVVKELYEGTIWPYLEEWPALGDVECGRGIGCLCGSEEDNVQEASEEEAAGM